MSTGRLFILCLFIALSASVAAQADDSSASNPKMSLPAQTAPAPATRSDLEKMFDPPSAQDNPSMDAALDSLAELQKPLRLDADKQNMLLQKEQRNLALLSLRVLELQKDEQSNSANTQQPKDVSDKTLAIDDQKIEVLQEQIGKCRQRIAMLQAGPMTIADLKTYKSLF